MDRPADVWEPLLAIAEAAGGDWPTRARGAAQALNAEREKVDSSFGVRLLTDVRTGFANRDRMRTAELLEVLCAMDEGPWGDLRENLSTPVGSRAVSSPTASRPMTTGSLMAPRKGICGPTSKTLGVDTFRYPKKGQQRQQATLGQPKTSHLPAMLPMLRMLPNPGMRGATLPIGNATGKVRPRATIAPSAAHHRYAGVRSEPSPALTSSPEGRRADGAEAPRELRPGAPTLAISRVGSATPSPFPAKTAWLDDSTLLVDWLPACEHVREWGYQIVTPAELPLDRRCQGTNKDGSRCRRNAGPGGWCAAHDPVRRSPS